ncbi:MAG TPA: HAMP domain-containing sensor histidine kinase [Verrucomicrobiae bacterium]|nr:HAMP domain-containing sensor histidine kinase [Verrucomicrobiae bacterium]
MFNFLDASMVAAARGRVSSLRWRLTVGALFAAGAAFVLNSISAGLGWYLAILLSMSFDYMLGNSYLESRGEADKRTAGALFVCGCVFSIAIFCAMPMVLSAFGGRSGRVLGVLMAASSLVSVMLFTFQSPRFMVLSAAPATIVLLAMPFIPFTQAPSDAYQGAIGVGCGVVGFLAYIGRSALNNTQMVNAWRTANQAAKDRQLDAELKRAEAEEANRAKSEFLAVMTHELRTPLNAVIGYAEIIQEDLEADGRKELADDASRITGSARHLLGLIDQILNLSSVDAGEQGLAPLDVDVRKLLEEAVHALQDEAREAGNRISLRVDPDAEWAYTDGGKLVVCAAAVLSNAVKFTNNGLIAVSAAREEIDGRNHLVISVSDTGVGIKAGDMDRVFKPFTQLDGSSTRTKGGMGLGLSIAQRMANALGGEVSAVSEFGAGSTFTMRVPMRLAQGQAQTATRAAA